MVTMKPCRKLEINKKMIKAEWNIVVLYENTSQRKEEICHRTT